MLRIVARHADVWNPAADGLEAACAAGKQLLASCHDVGRGPAEIRWSTQLEFDGNTPSAMFEQMRRWHAAGFSELIISCTGPEPVKAAEVAAEKLLRAARELL